MHRKRKNIIFYSLTTVIVLVYLMPVLFMVLLSLKPIGSPMGSALLHTSGYTLANYIDVFSSGLYTDYLLNGLFVACVSALASVTIGFFASYALSRFRFPMKEQFFIGMIAIKALPPVLTSIAFFHIAVQIRLYDTLWILVILDSITNVPLSVFMLRNFMDAIPKDLDEAAKIDGCGQWKYICKVILPLSASGIAAILVQCFLLSWNEYMYAVLFISSEKYKMPTVAIYDFVGQWSTNYIGIVTFAVLLSVPVIILFLAMQKNFVKGMLSGSEK